MKDYLKLFETQSGQGSETFAKAPSVQPTKPTKPGSVGFVGCTPSAFPKVLPSEANPPMASEAINTLQNELPDEPTKPTKPDELKTCERCGVAMACIELGYYSCPACHYQVVEARSGFWTSGQSREMREAA
jgi:hypothetical protein